MSSGPPQIVGGEELEGGGGGGVKPPRSRQELLRLGKVRHGSREEGLGSFS